MYADNKLESFLRKLRLTEDEYLNLKEHCKDVLNSYAEEVQTYAMERLLNRKVYAIIPFLKTVCQNRQAQYDSFLGYPENIREKAQAHLRNEIKKGTNITDKLAFISWKCELLNQATSKTASDNEQYDLSAYKDDEAFLEKWEWVNSTRSSPFVFQVIEDKKQIQWHNPEQQELLQRRAEERYSNYKNPRK